MEVLCLQHQDMLAVFEDEFVVMTRNPITLQELRLAPANSRKPCQPDALTLNQRQFLVSLCYG
jgi:hypothetical protein